MWEYLDKKRGRWYVGRGLGKRGKQWVNARPRFVWESVHGKIEKGTDIHHINFDKTDDRIENLVAVPRKQHLLIHAEEDKKKIRKIIDGVNHKWCSKCKTYKPFSFFYILRGKYESGYCKSCMVAYSNAWFKANKDKRNQYANKWRRNNREKDNAYQREYWRKRRLADKEKQELKT